MFFNTPARLKFVKSPAVEAAKVSDVVLSCHSFPSRNIHSSGNNHKTVYHSPGSGPKDAIVSVYGKQVGIRFCLFLSARRAKKKGYIGGAGAFPPDACGANADRQRASHSKQAIVGSRTKGIWTNVDDWPVSVFVLNLEMPYANVDVNVHPQKVEVRFADPLAISNSITEAVQQSVALQQKKGRKETESPFSYQERFLCGCFFRTGTTADGIGRKGQTDDMVSAFKEEDAQHLDYTKHTLWENEKQRPASFTFRLEAALMSCMKMRVLCQCIPLPFDTAKKETSSVEMTAERRSLGEHPIVLGQLFETYLLVQSGQVFYIIDQHAGARTAYL